MAKQLLSKACGEMTETGCGASTSLQRGRKKLVRALQSPAPLERTKDQGHTVSKGAGRAQLGGGRQCWVGRGSEAARAAGPDGEFISSDVFYY